MIWYIVYSTVLLLIMLHVVSGLVSKNKKLLHENRGLNIELRDVENQRKKTVEQLEATTKMLEYAETAIKNINEKIFGSVGAPNSKKAGG